MDTTNDLLRHNLNHTLPKVILSAILLLVPLQILALAGSISFGLDSGYCFNIHERIKDNFGIGHDLNYRPSSYSAFVGDVNFLVSGIFQLNMTSTLGVMDPYIMYLSMSLNPQFTLYQNPDRALIEVYLEFPIGYGYNSVVNDISGHYDTDGYYLGMFIPGVKLGAWLGENVAISLNYKQFTAKAKGDDYTSFKTAKLSMSTISLNVSVGFAY